MNRMKKFASIMLALVMAFALMAPAFASGETDTTPPETTEKLEGETGSITINNATAGHTYDAYQIFKGDLSYTGTNSDGDAKDPVLSNIEWGSGVISDGAALAAAKKVAGLENATSAADVAALLADTKNGISAEAFAQAINEALVANPPASSQKVGEGETSVTIDNVSVGYYLIKDNPNDPETKPDATSLFMLQVVGPTVVTSKVDVPTPDKKIVEGNKKVNVGDYDIGETITFELSATLPNNFENYKTYKLVFHDTMSEGLTFDKVTSIKLGETVIFNDETAKTYVTAPAEDGHSLDVTFKDLKTVMTNAGNGSVITVTYTGHLNENAVVGNPGNPNKMHLEFSNNPNDEGKGETGETPDKEVIVFTFELDATKVDGASWNEDEGKYDVMLAGAEFVLKNAQGNGQGVQYAVINADTGKFIRWSDDKIDNTNDAKETTKLVSDIDGNFKVSGIDAGIYYLEETKAPVGYNLPNPAETKIEIKAAITEAGSSKDDGTTADKTQVTKLEIVVGDATEGTSGSTEDGTVATTIENNKGATLPETGGIGTTIFYALGGLLTVGAVVLLVTKKRMNADDK